MPVGGAGENMENICRLGRLERDGYSLGFASGGTCVCVNCAKILPSVRGQSCCAMICPECGSRMIENRY